MNYEHFFGYKVIVNDFMQETKIPKKLHTKKSKMSYHNRIQKKWNKRYGFVMEYGCIKIENTLIVHPKIYKELKRKLT